MSSGQITLRDYQLDAINKTRSLIKSGKKRIVLVLPTGAGKTTIAAEIIRSAQARGSKIAFLAHRKELIDQASKRLDDMGVDHGVCKAQHHRTDPRKSVQVASVQSLVNRTAIYSFDIIFIDECHRANAGTYKKILESYPSSCVIGLTATPYRSDGQGLGDIFEEMVVVRSMRQLISDGHLIAPRYLSKSIDISSIKTSGNDFDAEDMGTRLSSPSLVGDIVAEWKKHATGRTTVGFASNVDHSIKCVEAFNAAGISAEHLDATIDDREREAILRRLADGTTMVVFNVGILSEGWDLPKTSCCIVATLTLSRMKWMQMAGRVLRPDRVSGKIDAKIIDHYGNCFIHGPVESEYELSLDGIQKKTKKKAEEALKMAKVCKHCFAPNPSDAEKCGVCNHPLVTPRQIKTQSGELVDVGSILPKEILVEIRQDSQTHHRLYVDGKHVMRVPADDYVCGSWRMMQYVGGGYYVHAGQRHKWYSALTYLKALGSKCASKRKMDIDRQAFSEIAKQKGYKASWVNVKMGHRYGRP